MPARIPLAALALLILVSCGGRRTDIDPYSRIPDPEPVGIDPEQLALPPDRAKSLLN